MTAAKKVLDKITSYSSVVIFIAMVLMVTYQVIAKAQAALLKYSQDTVSYG